MIAGLGSDICNIERIADSYRRFGERFLKRCYGNNERRELPPENSEKKYYASLAKRFAAKEAFSKALGTGFNYGLSWVGIEILHNENGKPYICLSGKAAEMAEERKIKNILVSLSDDYPFAQAVVILEV